MNFSPGWGVATVLFVNVWAVAALGQVECDSTGMLRGVRIDGELFAFESHVRAIAADAPPDASVAAGGRGEGQYARDAGAGGGIVATGRLSAGRGPPVGTYRIHYQDAPPGGGVKAEIQIRATVDAPLRGVYFAVTFSASDYAGGSVGPVEPADAQPARPLTPSFLWSATARGVRVDAGPERRRRRFDLAFPEPRPVTVQADPNRNGGAVEIAFPLVRGDLKAGQEVTAAFAVRVAGEVDQSPARLAIDPARPGRAFDGIGGNFRLQISADAAQVQYNLEHLRVAWGRVAMRLDRWHPDEQSDPAAAADPGAVDGRVRADMEMAQRLARRKIPIMISVWSAPSWALGREDGQGGEKRIAPEKREALFESIASYVAYLKEHYGAEPALFSFNESDIGIDVLQSPEEHADTIKRLGAVFAARGLATQMALGDTGNPKATKFIDPALADPAAAKFIGAVSFHSWWGGTTEQYARWGEAARQLGVPLLVAEGGTDPHAYRGRPVFLEPWYALDEAAQYVEICRVAQPRSILHWQLTSDYGVLTGGGGRDGRPLAPAQRFWNLKQLGMTGPGATAVPVTCDARAVTACAFADQGAYVVHLVNGGAARPATLSGFPDGVRSLRTYVTDARRGMQEGGRLPLSHGAAELTLDAMSFTSVVAVPGQ